MKRRITKTGRRGGGMKKGYYLFAASLIIFGLTFGIWLGVGKGNPNKILPDKPATWQPGPAFLPYIIKALLSATPTSTPTHRITCLPTVTYKCTPPPCPPGGHYECPLQCGCPYGCGVVCVPPTTIPPSPTEPPAGPTLTATPQQ